MNGHGRHGLIRKLQKRLRFQRATIYPLTLSRNCCSSGAGALTAHWPLDVILLSECDYIVCTLSSQVCRLAYELMQRHHTDASRLVYSLDDIYYYGGQQEHHLRALHHQTPEGGGNLNIAEGDVLKVAGNHLNGFSLGQKKGQYHRDLFPSYKVEEEIRVANFPTYPEVS
jgi:glycoprotein 6-alpha-L-fucosyltransferase